LSSGSFLLNLAGGCLATLRRSVPAATLLRSVANQSNEDGWLTTPTAAVHPRWTAHFEDVPRPTNAHPARPPPACALLQAPQATGDQPPSVPSAPATSLS